TDVEIRCRVRARSPRASGDPGLARRGGRTPFEGRRGLSGRPGAAAQVRLCTRVSLAQRRAPSDRARAGLVACCPPPPGLARSPTRGQELRSTARTGPRKEPVGGCWVLSISRLTRSEQAIARLDRRD